MNLSSECFQILHIYSRLFDNFFYQTIFLSDHFSTCYNLKTRTLFLTRIFWEFLLKKNFLGILV